MKFLRATRNLAAVLLLGSLTANCGDGGNNNFETSYTVDIAVTTSARLGALQIEVDYFGTDGAFSGSGDQIDCVSLVRATVAANAVSERVARIGMISLAGINTPAAILRCAFHSTGEVSRSSFDITVLDAARPNGTEVDPLPTVVVTGVSQGCVGTCPGDLQAEEP